MSANALRCRGGYRSDGSSDSTGEEVGEELLALAGVGRKREELLDRPNQPEVEP